jgi:hypothetical protein
VKETAAAAIWSEAADKALTEDPEDSHRVVGRTELAWIGLSRLPSVAA